VKSSSLVEAVVAASGKVAVVVPVDFTEMMM
jgi:hypothetical protein